MDPLRTINPNNGIQLNVTCLSICTGPSLGDVAGSRCAPSQMPAFGQLPGLGPAAGLGQQFGAVQGADPMAQQMMQTQMVMNQTLMQLMQVMLQLMSNKPSGASTAASGGAPSADTSSASNSSASGSSTSASTGAPGATDTGKKLADLAKAEATNGDSQGGWCYRDVSRALSKIGINVSGASAYMAADQLAKNPKVKEIKVTQGELAKLPAGAIVVWDKGAGHEHGHISISTGDGKEASDLMRNQITNYGTSFRVFMPQ